MEEGHTSKKNLKKLIDKQIHVFRVEESTWVHRAFNNRDRELFAVSEGVILFLAMDGRNGR